MRGLLSTVRSYPPDEPAGGNGNDDPSGGSSVSVSNCSCGGCIDEGLVTDCSAAGTAPTFFRIPMPAQYVLAFGVQVILAHEGGCTWKSATFEDVDLGDGPHDYFFKLVISNKGIEGVEVSLEDET